jgi:hypothetical protein
MQRYYFASLVFLFFFFGKIAFALEKLGPPTTPTGGSAYSYARIVIGIIIKIAIPALVVILVFFAFRIVTAQGDEKALIEARHRFKIAVIATIVFLGLGLIATIIFNTGSSIGYVELFSSDPTPFDTSFDTMRNTKLFK